MDFEWGPWRVVSTVGDDESEGSRFGPGFRILVDERPILSGSLDDARVLFGLLAKVLAAAPANTAETAETVCQEADRITRGRRAAEYGPPSEHFTRVAKLWSAVLGTEISAMQTAQCLLALKLSRTVTNVDRDGLVDIAGYAACMARLAGFDSEEGLDG